MHYVMSDLHGHYHLFLEMLERIDFKSEDHLYILGDVCDRGPQSYEIYHYILSHSSQITLLKGNHEVMMLEGLRCGCSSLWFLNGGSATVQSLQGHEVEPILEYIQSCPCYVEISCGCKEYLLVHAGIDPYRPYDMQDEESYCWIRDLFFTGPGVEDKVIVFGHTPTNYLHQKRHCFDVWYDPIYHNKIGIDGGLACKHQGQLNCLCLDTGNVVSIKKRTKHDC